MSRLRAPRYAAIRPHRQLISVFLKKHGVDFNNAVRAWFDPDRLDFFDAERSDSIEWFRSFGKRYQTRMNAALYEYMLSNCGGDAMFLENRTQ